MELCKMKQLRIKTLNTIIDVTVIMMRMTYS